MCDMVRDAMIPDHHFGAGWITFSAIATGIFRSTTLWYNYQLKVQPAGQLASLLHDHGTVGEEHQQGQVHYTRRLQVNDRNLYVCDEFNAKSHETYKRINGVEPGSGKYTCPINFIL